MNRAVCFFSPERVGKDDLKASMVCLKKEEESVVDGVDGFLEAETLDELRAHMREESVALVYVYGESCSVCHAVLPQIKPIVEQFESIRAMQVDSEKIPAVSGELTVLTNPVVLLFVEGKEVLRMARFIEKGKLEDQLRKITLALMG